MVINQYLLEMSNYRYNHVRIKLSGKISGQFYENIIIAYWLIFGAKTEQSDKDKIVRNHWKYIFWKMWLVNETIIAFHITIW